MKSSSKNYDKDSNKGYIPEVDTWSRCWIS